MDAIRELEARCAHAAVNLDGAVDESDSELALATAEEVQRIASQRSSVPEPRLEPSAFTLFSSAMPFPKMPQCPLQPGDRSDEPLWDGKPALVAEVPPELVGSNDLTGLFGIAGSDDAIAEFAVLLGELGAIVRELPDTLELGWPAEAEVPSNDWRWRALLWMLFSRKGPYLDPSDDPAKSQAARTAQPHWDQAVQLPLICPPAGLADIQRAVAAQRLREATEPGATQDALLDAALDVSMDSASGPLAQSVSNFLEQLSGAPSGAPRTQPPRTPALDPHRPICVWWPHMLPLQLLMLVGELRRVVEHAASTPNDLMPLSEAAKQPELLQYGIVSERTLRRRAQEDTCELELYRRNGALQVSLSQAVALHAKGRLKGPSASRTARSQAPRHESAE